MAGNLPYRTMRCAFYENVTYFLTFSQCGVVATVTALVTVGFSHVGKSHRRSTKSRGGTMARFALMEGPTVRKPLTVATRCCEGGFGPDLIDRTTSLISEHHSQTVH